MCTSEQREYGQCNTANPRGNQLFSFSRRPEDGFRTSVRVVRIEFAVLINRDRSSTNPTARPRPFCSENGSLPPETQAAVGSLQDSAIGMGLNPDADGSGGMGAGSGGRVAECEEELDDPRQASAVCLEWTQTEEHRASSDLRS